jgi:hypothetical protein
MDHFVCEGAAEWTRIASGGGTASGLYLWGSTKTLPTWPAITGIKTLAWAIWQNASGAQLCVQINSSGQINTLKWSPSGSFLVGASNQDTLPADPADVVTHTAGGNLDIGYATGVYTISMAYTTDHNSFIIFGRRTADDFGACFITLEDTKTGDTQPYWCWFHIGTSNFWTRTELSTQTGNYLMGYHPINGAKVYNISEAISVKSISPMDSIGADPVSGNIPRIDSICVCGTGGSLHIRGKVPGIYRVPTVLGTGDRIDDAGGGVYDYVVIGDYCVPWGSSAAMLW